MEDELFADWVKGELSHIFNPDLVVLEGVACPEGGCKTGIFLTDEQKKSLALLARMVASAKKEYQAFANLGAADQKVRPFQALCVLSKRCEFLSRCLWLSIEGAVPPKFYGFVGIGFDESFEIWVGPGLRRDLQDLRHVFYLYPQRP